MELCEFLLREFPTYYSETDLRRALNGFIQYNLVFCDLDRQQRKFHKLTEAFYTLFLRKYGISTDLHDLIDRPTVESVGNHWFDGVGSIESNSLLTDETLQQVIMSQAIPFNKWHATDRFCAAVNARGWPTGAFVKLIGAESDAQLAQWTDSRGKTALHWAAEHFGCWMSHTVMPVSSKDAAALQGEYGELCTMLMRNGANPNALDSENRTPFTCLLRAMHTMFDCWSEDNLCDAVVQWGQHIQAADVSLHAYATAENCLQSRYGSGASNLCIRLKGDPWVCRLIISETSTLEIEVGCSVSRPLWQYSPPPGTWRGDKHELETIGWSPDPYFEGDEYVLWKQAENLNINLRPVVARPQQASVFLVDASSAWRGWATGVQDDHGFICMTLQRLPRVSGRRGGVRRAASLPPPITIFDDYSVADGERCLIFMGTADGWISNPHKCPLDLTWKSTYCTTNDWRLSRRRCMLGRCDDGEPDLLHSRHWEVKLLDDESNIEIARRFTDRFRPEWRHIIEENHRMRQRRAELGMSAT